MEVSKIFKIQFSCSYTKDIVAVVTLHANTLEEAIEKARVSYILNSDLVIESVEELPDKYIKI